MARVHAVADPAGRTAHARAAPLSHPAAHAGRVHLSGFPRAVVRRVHLDRRHVDAEGRAELARLRPHQIVVLPRPRRLSRPAADPAASRSSAASSPIATIAAGCCSARSTSRWRRRSRSPRWSSGTSFSIWHILALSFIAGLAQAFGGPAYQSLIPSLVDKKDLPNAIALNSIQFNLARVFGPLLAGVDDGGVRHGRLLRAERPVVPRRHRRAAVAAHEAHPADRPQADPARDARAGSPTRAASRRSSR